MTVLALFLTAVGVADLLRRHDGPLATVLGALAGAGLLVVGSAGAGVEGWGRLLIGTEVVLLAAWVQASRRRGWGRLAIGVLGLGVGAPILLSGAVPAAGDGWLRRGYAAMEVPALGATSFETAAMTVGAAVALWATANRTVRLVLDGVGADVLDAENQLRGGRVLGPLERLLILALALGGQVAVVAAVLAAKGILRFPEISRSEPGGEQAEYVLVGSFVSWTVAAGAVVLVSATT